jgi:DNA-binding response OmpR family regulator
VAGHRILVIDDDKDICSILKTALSKNYEVITAHDGYAGLQKVQGCEPDLVILDVMMPKLNGHQLCDAIKHSRKNKNTIVIFITGHGSKEDETTAFQQGADLYVRKPFDLVEVVNEIDRLLAQVTAGEKTLSYKEILSLE